MTIFSHIYIIEDRLLHRSIIQTVLVDLLINRPSIEILPVSDYIAFFNTLDTLPILDTDIFIIDIDLNTFHNGLDYAKKIRAHNELCSIIFLTADAGKGIDVINNHINASTYLVKEDFDPSLLKIKLQRELLQIEAITNVYYSKNSLDYIQIKTKEKIFNVKVADIVYIEALTDMKGYLLFKTTSQELIVRSTIKDMKACLLSFDYIYSELKSFIINLHSISTVDINKNEILFTTGDSLLGGKKMIKKVYQAVHSN